VLVQYPCDVVECNLRENKPFTGSFFLPYLFAPPGKPRNALLLYSFEKYAYFTLCLPKYGRFAPRLLATKGSGIEAVFAP
jgi:hypothetical protein